MGVYVVFCCDEKKEFIDPGDVNNGAIKTGAVCYRDDLGRLLIHLLSYTYPNKWKSVRLVTDSEFGYHQVYEAYADATEAAVQTYNEHFQHRDMKLLEYTGKHERSYHGSGGVD